jgi:integrase
LRGLQWRDLDLGTGFLVVRQAKNREGRTIPLPAALVAILEDHRSATRPRDGQAFVFVADWSPMGRLHPRACVVLWR